MLHAIIFWLTMMGFMAYTGSGLKPQADPWGRSCLKGTSSHYETINKDGLPIDGKSGLNKPHSQVGYGLEDKGQISHNQQPSEPIIKQLKKPNKIRDKFEEAWPDAE